jgi:[acyl-carrier-protein] S-malonyltransferase
VKAFVFPGQGSQFVGMGKELIDEYPEYRKYFDIAKEETNVDFEKIIYKGSEEQLTKTENAQPAIMTVSYIAYKYLTEKKKISADVVAGHSLGEWTALIAAEVIGFRDAVKLVRKRGEYMSESCKSGTGLMAAVIGLKESAVNRIIRGFDSVFIANINSPEQIVISGRTDQIEMCLSPLKRAGAKKVIPLNVSGAFHTVMMEKAAKNLSKDMKNVKFRIPKMPIVQNVTADYEYDPEIIKKNLLTQITHPVRWSDSIVKMREKGVSEFIEVGFRNILIKLIKRIDNNSVCKSFVHLLKAA